MKDKAAITKSAQKYAAKGQIDKAIAEWEKLLSKDKDVNVYNIIGDLYLKKGAKREAIESFTKAANIFRENGFYLKAIALYKKILNILPSETGALTALAELNVEKGLIGNAIDNFFTAAEIYIKEGATQKAAEIYKKVIQLSPSNIVLKIKIADLYHRAGLSEEAAKEYVKIASDYLEKNEPDKAQDLYLKATGIDPQNIPSLIGLSKIAEKANNIEQAFEYLKNALSSVPDNKDLLLHYSMLTIKTDKIDDAKNTLSKLLEIDPSNIQAKKLLGSIYLNEGLIEKAWDELVPHIDETLNAEKWDKAFEFLDNFKELRLIPVKRRLVSLYKGKDDKDAVANELKEMAKLYEDEGLHHNALQVYKESLELHPDDESAISKIKELENILGLETPQIETAPIEEKPVTDVPAVPPAPEKAEFPLQEGETISPRDFEEKKAEADFYAQQGFKDEAIKAYESLLAISPDNEEIQKKLEELKPAAKPGGKPAEEESIEITADKASVYSDSAEDILQAFKSGIEKEVGEKDHETHYNLGIAYKEMGILEDAIKEFRIAAKNPGKALQSSSMIALCYMEKEAYPLAIKELKKAIEGMSPADKGHLEIKYELAEAYIKNKDYDNALKIYIEINTQNPEFRDVAHKLESLRPEDKLKTKKDRVSYI